MSQNPVALVGSALDSFPAFAGVHSQKFEGMDVDDIRADLVENVIQCCKLASSGLQVIHGSFEGSELSLANPIRAAVKE